MTEYKMGLLSFVNHLPVLLLEGALIYGVSLITFYQWIWVMITSIIFGVTLILIVIDSYRVYGISKTTFLTRVGKRKTEYLLINVKTVKIRKRSIELGFKDSGKVKTIYLGWYITKYKKLKDELLDYLKQLDNYDRIIFID